jgi:tyrosyl-tRNA synthetase
MLRYYDLLSAKTFEEIRKMKEELQSGQFHPMEAKKQLAAEIVDRYHGIGSGMEERRRFEELFSKKTLTADLPQVKIELDPQGSFQIVNFLVAQNIVKSKSEARRLIQQKAVKLNNEVVSEESVQLESGKEHILRAGKLHLIKLQTS